MAPTPVHKFSGENNKNHEVHPNWYYDIPDMETLLLGSYPPHENKRHYPFYYPNTQNRFWKILALIAHKELTAITSKNKTPELQKMALQERHDIMQNLKIGVQNMGLEITRIGESARDTAIEIISFQDILSIIKTHPRLNKILLPGFSAKSSTYCSFITYLKLNGIKVDEKVKPYAGFVFYIKVFSKRITCVVLNSTSTATKIPFKTVLEQFEKHLK